MRIIPTGIQMHITPLVEAIKYQLQQNQSIEA